MPRGDRTGPTGLGAKTGRGTGYCNGNTSAGFMNPTASGGRGRGLGGGDGRRFGGGAGYGGGRFRRRHRYWQNDPGLDVHYDATSRPQDRSTIQPRELAALREQIARAEQVLESLQRRIDAVTSPQENEKD